MMSTDQTKYRSGYLERLIIYMFPEIASIIISISVMTFITLAPPSVWGYFLIQ